MSSGDRVPVSPSTWARLSPLGEWKAPVLDAVEAHLADPEVQEALRRHERDGAYPAEVIAALRSRGVTSIFTEASRITAYHICRLNDVTARFSGSLAISVGVQGLALLPVYIAGDRAQRERVFSMVEDGCTAALLLTEWEHGSDLAGTETRAEPVDGGFRLTGEKHLINGGREAHLLVTLARTAEVTAGDGPFGRSGGLSVLLVERDETVEALRSHRTLPVPAADISGVRFRATEVGHESLVGEVGEGFSIIQRALILSRGGIASFASGTSTAAWDLSRTYACERRIYEAPLLELGAIRDHLLQVAALDALTSALAVKAAAAMNALGQGSGYLTAAAKLACCSMAESAVDEGRRLFGARALLDELPYARLVRDSLVYGVFDGTTHVMLARLRDYLVQMVRNAAPEPETARAWTAALYSRSPRSLLEMSHRRRRADVPSIAGRARALDRLSGAVDLSPLVATADAALELAEELGPGGRWAQDQGAGYELAGSVARLEAVIALVELADEDRRQALGMAPMAEPLVFGDDLLRYAVATGGRDCATRLRRLAESGGRRRSDLEEAERTWTAEVGTTRVSLHRRVRDDLSSERRNV